MGNPDVELPAAPARSEAGRKMEKDGQDFFAVNFFKSPCLATAQAIRLACISYFVFTVRL
jgi:hypothetical protein